MQVPQVISIGGIDWRECQPGCQPPDKRHAALTQAEHLRQPRQVVHNVDYRDWDRDRPMTARRLE